MQTGITADAESVSYSELASDCPSPACSCQFETSMNSLVGAQTLKLARVDGKLLVRH